MAEARWTPVERIDYDDALALQERLSWERRHDLRPDTLMLCEHPPTITIGRRGSDAEVLWDEERLSRGGIAIRKVGRGGGTTYHGPGQLVGYPIIRLDAAGRAVRAFVARLERLLIEALRPFGAFGMLRAGHPGIWIGQAKLVALGIEVRRGVTKHGFALNVAMDLSPFDAIVPCKMPGLQAIDLERATGRRIAVNEVAASLVARWEAGYERVECERICSSPTPGSTGGGAR